MQVIVNGAEMDVASEARVVDVLAQLSLHEQPCAVEVNRRLVPKREHASHAIEPGDRIEVVTLVGGG